MNEKELEFKIVDFCYDSRRNDVFFIKELIDEKKKARKREEYFAINRLKFEGEDKLVGIENSNTKISYSRPEYNGPKTPDSIPIW